jgi:hypothetical protein
MFLSNKVSGASITVASLPLEEARPTDSEALPLFVETDRLIPRPTGLGDTLARETIVLR